MKSCLSCPDQTDLAKATTRDKHRGERGGFIAGEVALDFGLFATIYLLLAVLS